MKVSQRTTKYKVGTVVSCDYCGGHRAIEEIRMYKGGMGFELSCGDRNGYCATCDKPVRDTSLLPDTICPECWVCTTALELARSLILPVVDLPEGFPVILEPIFVDAQPNIEVPIELLPDIDLIIDPIELKAI
ncbi:MAG: hypothetical protein IPG58_01665 [Acidobacteria bacterium]|nr:hypothetical protein [Acidobacteriota bacterium]